MDYCSIALLMTFSIDGMIHPTTTEGFLDDHPDSYWLVADVLGIEWRKGCLTTAGCAEPKFQVIKINTANNEANLISWPVTLKLAEETSRLFISHWISRSVGDITLKCEVAGLDPTYGFPRICDTTPSKRIVDDQNDYQSSTKQYSSNGKLVLEVKGKCFNASLTLQKYDRCPTCLEHRIAVVEQYTDPETSNDLLYPLDGSSWFLYAVLVLSALTVILTTAFACLLIAFLHQKHQLNVSTSKKLLRSELPNITHPLRTYEDDLRYRYDELWEQVPTIHRQLSYRSFKNKNNFRPVPPSLMDPITDAMASAQSNCRKTSPSSSFRTGPHDSGLNLPNIFP
ncbi:Uncharacterized protein BM_BM10675 [Brugia malayi]|uniref:Bm10675 n=1 Tax=Brugia malayi TaxID=6279 RepID=A0A4E9F3W2_BRUMA|nr:Uncharacterized protein BM_BM10675 [Brugia malayi]VIO91394.1 Uncharacterized protein BM_BM10675 [Brugia malayi]